MILVAGEALIDLVPDGPDGMRVHCGGGPFNTARWLSRLGQPVGFLGSLSDDALGERLRGALVDDGVSLELSMTTSLPTTLALASVDGSGAADYRFYTESTAAFALTAEQALGTLPVDFEALHVGSLALVLEPIAGAVAEVVRRAAGGDTLVTLDPNIRPEVIRDRSAYLERLREVIARAHLIKLSVEDLAWLAPGEQRDAGARELLRRGPAAVILTAGPDGAVVFTAEAEAAVPAVATEVVDTIGAGDAFTAGFIAHWRHRGLAHDQLSDVDELVAATRFACLVAARACAQAGAAPVDVPLLS